MVHVPNIGGMTGSEARVVFSNQGLGIYYCVKILGEKGKKLGPRKEKRAEIFFTSFYEFSCDLVCSTSRSRRGNLHMF